MVWISQHNLADINKLWYKVLKSTLGATFNVKLELCEIISGLPPIVVQNSINSIKHFLKLNIKKDDNDPLRMLINKGIQPGPSKDLHGKLQQVFKFLQWKLMLSPECFTASDQIIVEENIVDYFADLSSTCCSYTKSMVKEYTEKLWQNSIQNKWLLNGSNIIPTVSCSSLVFKSSIPRNIETLTLSLFYPNNLLNLFLYEHFPEICSSPLCGCGANVQSLFHVACECNPSQAKSETVKQIRAICNVEVSSDLLPDDFSTTLLNHSRQGNFLSLLVERVNVCLEYLKQTVNI